MKTVIVPIKYGSSLCHTPDGWFLWEVDKSLLIDVKKPAGIHQLMECKTLDEVRKLVNPDRPPREPTLFKVRLLKSMFGNSEGDILKVKMVEDGDIYYYDGFHRWCYLEAAEEGITWERV